MDNLIAILECNNVVEIKLSDVGLHLEKALEARNQLLELGLELAHSTFAWIASSMA